MPRCSVVLNRDFCGSDVGVVVGVVVVSWCFVLVDDGVGRVIDVCVRGGG